MKYDEWMLYFSNTWGMRNIFLLLFIFSFGGALARPKRNFLIWVEHVLDKESNCKILLYTVCYTNSACFKISPPIPRHCVAESQLYSIYTCFLCVNKNYPTFSPLLWICLVPPFTETCREAGFQAGASSPWGLRDTTGKQAKGPDQKYQFIL